MKITFVNTNLQEKECEELIKFHLDILGNKSWAKIKVFVQNCYMKKKSIAKFSKNAYLCSLRFQRFIKVNKCDINLSKLLCFNNDYDTKKT